jgi:hypothetical protein
VHHTLSYDIHHTESNLHTCIQKQNERLLALLTYVTTQTADIIIGNYDTHSLAISSSATSREICIFERIPMLSILAAAVEMRGWTPSEWLYTSHSVCLYIFSDSEPALTGVSVTKQLKACSFASENTLKEIIKCMREFVDCEAH